MKFHLVVHEEPVPQGRPRARVFGGHAQLYKPAASRLAEDRIAAAARDLWGDAPPLRGAVGLSATAYVRRPKSAPRRVVYPEKKPDLDNYIKTAMDSLTRAGIWTDDSQVVDIIFRKRFALDLPYWEIQLEDLSTTTEE